MDLSVKSLQILLLLTALCRGMIPVDEPKKEISVSIYLQLATRGLCPIECWTGSLFPRQSITGVKHDFGGNKFITDNSVEVCTMKKQPLFLTRPVSMMKRQGTIALQLENENGKKLIPVE